MLSAREAADAFWAMRQLQPYYVPEPQELDGMSHQMRKIREARFWALDPEYEPGCVLVWLRGEGGRAGRWEWRGMGVAVDAPLPA